MHLTSGSVVVYRAQKIPPRVVAAAQYLRGPLLTLAPLAVTLAAVVALCVFSVRGERGTAVCLAPSQPASYGRDKTHAEALSLHRF